MEKVKKLRYKGIDYIAYNYEGKQGSFNCNGTTIEDCRKKRNKYFRKISTLKRRAGLTK